MSLNQSVNQNNDHFSLKIKSNAAHTVGPFSSAKTLFKERTRHCDLDCSEVKSNLLVWRNSNQSLAIFLVNPPNNFKHMPILCLVWMARIASHHIASHRVGSFKRNKHAKLALIFCMALTCLKTGRRRSRLFWDSFVIVMTSYAYSIICRWNVENGVVKSFRMCRQLK